MNTSLIKQLIHLSQYAFSFFHNNLCMQFRFYSSKIHMLMFTQNNRTNDLHIDQSIIKSPSGHNRLYLENRKNTLTTCSLANYDPICLLGCTFGGLLFSFISINRSLSCSFTHRKLSQNTEITLYILPL